MTKIIIRNSDNEVIAWADSNFDLTLTIHPIQLGYACISDPQINETTCVIKTVSDFPVDFVPGWYTHTDNDGFVITAFGTAEKAKIAKGPVPTSVTPAQARVALVNAGLFDAADAAVNATGVNGATWQWWHYALSFRRDSLTLNQLAAILTLTSDQVDDLFRAAELLEA